MSDPIEDWLDRLDTGAEDDPIAAMEVGLTQEEIEVFRLVDEAAGRSMNPPISLREVRERLLAERRRRGR